MLHFSRNVANSASVPLPFPVESVGGIDFVPESSPEKVVKEYFKRCWYVLHSMALHFLVNTVQTIVFMLVVRSYRLTML